MYSFIAELTEGPGRLGQFLLWSGLEHGGPQNWLASANHCSTMHPHRKYKEMKHCRLICLSRHWFNIHRWNQVKAETMFGKTAKVLRRQYENLKLKLRLFNSCVIPDLVKKCWPISKETKGKLHVKYNGWQWHNINMANMANNQGSICSSQIHQSVTENKKIVHKSNISSHWNMDPTLVYSRKTKDRPQRQRTDKILC